MHTLLLEKDAEERLLGNDLVINENSCNLSCSYCLTGQSNLKASHEGKLIFQPPIIDRYTEASGLGARLNRIVERVNQKLAPPLLKLTGGEIFIVKGIMEFIEKVAPWHEAVIVQTNGLPLTDEKIERLVRLGNITVQISLDSSNYLGNSYRVQSESIHDMILERIRRVVQSGLPLEIYGVLNDRSAPYLREFAEWCGQFRDNAPQLFPFPVRGPDCENFRVRPEQYHYVDELHTLLPEFAHVLPPKPYLDRLSAFYHDGARSWRCHLPRLVVSTFDDGVATPCPNIWFHKMGDLTTDDWQDTLAQVNRTGFYELLLGERPRLDACKGCFTPWDTLSLYFEDCITLDELCRAPSYAPPGIRRLLETKKADLADSRPLRASWTELRQQAVRYANATTVTSWVEALTPIQAGDRVVFYADNTIQHAALLLLLLDQGISPLVLPPDSASEEAQGYGREVGARYLLRLANDNLLAIERLALASRACNDAGVAHGVGLYLLTSGSTGRATAVFRPLSSWKHEAKRYLDMLHLGPGHHVLLASPIYHAYAMGWLWAAVSSGCALEICRPTQLARIVDALRLRATHCALTPFLASLLARRIGQGPRPAQLDVVMAGAGPVDAALEAQFQSAFGLGLSRNYGSTESGALFAGLAPLPPLSIGRLLPGLSIAYREDGRQPFALEVELEDGRIYATGDIVREDDHGYQVIGRETAAIRRGESWISPFEIESVLRQCPQVEDCQVRGVKSQRSAGNDHILAVIVLRPGTDWDEAQMRQFCRERLRETKIPDVFEIVETIRRSVNGKTARSQVYRWAEPEQLVEAVNAYKRSAILFALLETAILERIDGQTSVDQIALSAGVHAETLGELLHIAELNGLLQAVDSPSAAAAPLSRAVSDVVRLECKAARHWNQIDSLSAIVRHGRLRRPFAAQTPSTEFIECYQCAMNGPHKQRSVQLALRKLVGLRPGPYRILDLSATSGAYSKRFAEKGLLGEGMCLLVGGLNPVAEPVAGVRQISLDEAISGPDRFDVLVLDNAVHHHDVARNLMRLTERLEPSGVIILDEIFIGAGAGAAIGVDWMTHGGMCHLKEESVDLLMLNLGFHKLEVMKAEAMVSHRLNLYTLMQGPEL